MKRIGTLLVRALPYAMIAIGVAGALLCFVLPTRQAHAFTPSSYPAATYGRVTCATTATPIPPTSLTGRNRLIIDNGDSATIYIGWDASVTASGATGGLPVRAATQVGLDESFNHVQSGSSSVVRGQAYCISAAGTATNSVAWMELK